MEASLSGKRESRLPYLREKVELRPVAEWVGRFLLGGESPTPRVGGGKKLKETPAPFHLWYSS